jgi:ABC-type multidrug transport system permease subunit
VVCSSLEFTHFNPPPGQTCAQYAGHFVSQIAKAGYLSNPNATSNCSYCPFASGYEYTRTLNVHDGDKWRCFGIFLAFCLINWGLVYFMIYTVRIKGWSFGFGPLFRLLGNAVDGVKNVVFSRRQKLKEEK